MISLVLFLGEFGPTEIILVLAVVLILFGGKKIPELMKGLGSGVREFKNAAKDDKPADKTEETN
jgi:sec-independent protein translocase protein TatA